MPDCHETGYCLEIQVTLTEEGRAIPPPPHAWQAPMVEAMLCYSKDGLTEVTVMGPGWAMLFYGRQLVEKGLARRGVRCHVYTIRGP